VVELHAGVVPRKGRRPDEIAAAEHPRGQSARQVQVAGDDDRAR
jgi:hypothetical protein